MRRRRRSSQFIFIFFVLALTFLCINGCNNSHSTQEKQDQKNVEILRDLPTDFSTPQNLWKMIESEELDPHSTTISNGHGSASGHGAAPAKEVSAHHGEPAKVTAHSGAGGSTGAAGGVIFSSIDVILEEKTPGVLKSPHMQISFPRGGGTLDLSHYVNEKVGSFFIRFVTMPQEKKVSEKTIFWSRAKKRKIGDEIHGSGCNKILVMGSKWEKLNRDQGFKANTYRMSHATVLGGRYFFITKTDKDLFVSQILVTDSQHTDFFCEERSAQLVSK